MPASASWQRVVWDGALLAEATPSLWIAVTLVALSGVAQQKGLS